MSPDELLHLLKRPFDPKAISWRVGSTNQEKTKGLALAYIDARDVMQRLDDVVGAQGWQDQYTETVKGRILCTISLKVEGEWIAKTDGAGDTDVEGDKGAISDAFKRAAVKWGIGRYLYYLDSPWVEIQPAGRSYKIAETPKIPDWATPEGYDERQKMYRFRKALELHQASVDAVKTYLAMNDLSRASEAWFELPKQAQIDLWIAPTKGGCFTTEERKTIMSREFTSANGGVHE